MSIAIIAPEKFRFQDLVCVDIALRRLEDPSAAFVPEPTGGEDGILTFDHAGGRRTLEVQVKGSAAAIDLPMLAEHLAHFPDRSATRPLFERLLADPQTAVLFAHSGRAVDALTPLLVDPEWDGHFSAGPRGKVVADGLIAAWRTAAWLGLADDGLDLARKQYLAVLANTPVQKVREALSRVFIAERETAPGLDIRLQQRLREWGVASDRLLDGVSRWLDALAACKRPQSDALPGLRQVLDSLAPRSLTPQGYLDRGSEDDLALHLARTGAVLLAGPPRVGKTWLARRVAGAQQRLGFDVRSGPRVEDAERFLSDPGGGDRLFLLDDPFGARRANPDAALTAEALRRLLDGLRPGARLLVSQAEGPILQHFRKATLADCTLGAWQWTTVGPLAVSLAHQVWREAAAREELEPAFIHRVVALITEREDLRDAGALAHLALRARYLHSQPSDEEILAQARADASDFARVLSAEQPAFGRLMIAAAIATEPGCGVAEPDLAFVLAGGEARPSLTPRLAAYDLFDESAPALPVYPAPPLAFAAWDPAALQTLVRRRILERPDTLANFAHPYFRAGAQFLTTPDLLEDLEELAGLLERALACRASATTLAAARNLDWIRERAAEQAKGLALVAGAAVKGLRSMFPATRDACFAFLMTVDRALPEAMRDDIPEWVQRVSVDIDQIEEADGVAVIMPGGGRWMDQLASVPLLDVQAYLDAIEQRLPIELGFATSRRILRALQDHPHAMTLAVAHHLLSADMAVIRAAAAEVWISIARPEVSGTADEDILLRIGEDRSPALAGLLLDQLVQSWPHLAGDRRSRLVSLLFSMSLSSGAATLLYYKLCKFDRVEIFGEGPPWPLFSYVMTAALNSLPDSVDFGDGRLFNVVEHAIRAGQEQALGDLLVAWSMRIVRKVNNSPYLYSDWDLAVLDPVLQALSGDRRQEIIDRLLAIRSTGAKTVFVRDFVNAWDTLPGEEKAKVSALLEGAQGDEAWLKATVLIRRKPPADLVAAIAGDPGVLDLRRQALQDRLGPGLTLACVHAYLGTGPLASLGGSHTEVEVWQDMVRWVASQPDHPAFAAALRDRLRFESETDVVAAIIAELPEAILPTVFDLLLEQKISSSGEWRTAAWRTLFARGRAAGLFEGWMVQIGASAPAFLDGLRELRLWLGEGEDALAVMPTLLTDFEAAQAAIRIDKVRTMLVAKSGGQDDQTAQAGASAAIPMGLLEAMLDKVEHEPPRLHDTWSMLADSFKRAGASSELLNRIEAHRRQAVDSMSQLQREARPDPVDALDHWIGPR